MPYGIATPDMSKAEAKRVRTALRRKRATRYELRPCTRCGGKGGSRGWPGFTCFRCGNHSPMVHERVRIRFYEDSALKAEDDRLTEIMAQWDRINIIASEHRQALEEDLKWEERRREQEERARNSFHVGEEGERIRDLPVEVVFTKEIEGYYGITRLVVMRTEDGACVKTFGSGSTLWDVDRGDWVLVTGTVKEHSEYRGEAQTMLSRVKLGTMG